jgi:pimeloyl-ACP methyl ester carboxylesterase
MRYVDTSSGRVAYVEHGTGVPLFLLHANPGDRRDWDGVVEALACEHRVIALDWPGYGESPAPTPPSSASALGYAALLVEVLEALSRGPAVLIGNSLGGFAAASVALERPELVRALVLVDPGGFTKHDVATRAFVRLKGSEWLTRRIAGRFARRYLVRRNAWTRAMIDRADAEQEDPAQIAVDAAVWRSFLDPRHDLRTRARAIRASTLLVWGRFDPNVRASRDGAQARAALPAAQWALLDTGHAPQAEDPEAFLAVVLPFLRAVQCA